VILKIADLNARYNAVRAIVDATLDVEEAEIVAVIGSNGAGKTTLMKTIAGLIVPFSGTIEFSGERIDRLQAYQVVKKGISLIPEGRQVFATMSVLENLLMGAYPRKRRIKSIEGELKQIWDRFPILHERMNQFAGTLSGGEQQMLAISRGLMSKPKMLLMDEPSLGLAPLMVKGIFGIVKNLNQEGITILIVEQMAKQALEIAKRAYIIEHGRIVLEGDSAALSRNERVKQAFLGTRQG
jgi:branched-chain amino acid transport system ATP-binding protein